MTESLEQRALRIRKEIVTQNLAVTECRRIPQKDTQRRRIAAMFGMSYIKFLEGTMSGAISSKGAQWSKLIQPVQIMGIIYLTPIAKSAGYE